MKTERQKHLERLAALIPDFKEERLVEVPVAIEASHENVPYDDPRFKDGFISEQDRTFEFVISDESVDQHGTVFYSSGWDFSLRERGKKEVSYQHAWLGDMNPDVVIGIGEERIEDKKVISKLRLEPYGMNTIADKVCCKLHFGSLTDASIEAYIVDGHQGKEEHGEDPEVFYFTRQILTGWSVVRSGSNRNAMIRKIENAQRSISNNINETIINAQSALIERIKTKSRRNTSL